MLEMNQSEIWVAFPYISNESPMCWVSEGTRIDLGDGRQMVSYNKGLSLRLLDEIKDRVFPSRAYALLYCARYMREKSAIFAAEADRQTTAAGAGEIVVVT